MKSHASITTRPPALAAIILLSFVSLPCWAETIVIEMDLPVAGAVEEASGYIVHATSAEAAARAVEAVGGEVTGEFAAMKAVGATLLPAQVELLKRRSDVLRVFEDPAAETSDTGLAARTGSRTSAL